MGIYVVQPGDTVDLIATNNSISTEELLYVNQIPSPYRLAVGEAIYIPETTSNAELPEVTVGGYAYPFISRYVLTQTLPFLTDLLIFSYGFTAEGDLIPPLTNPDWMIPLAKEYNVRPILVLTPFGEDGRFSNYLITTVINDSERTTKLIDSIITEVTTKGYEGVDIDFEYILATDREQYVSFVVAVREAVNALGYETSVALAPKTSATQTGLLYEGKDYGALGAAADYVFLMTYEWGYRYSSPMSVAPINMVRRVVEYALTEIPASKIHLGIPNYGYDWPLPYVQGETQASVVGNVEAVQLAIQNNAIIRFNETAQSPYFYYEDASILHEVWYEDVRDINAKFDLVQEYELRGFSYWTIMQLFRANWYLQQDRFTLRRT